MKFAIFGSGFGLYGYLPALMSGCGQTVCLPSRYKARLAERDDVRLFQDHVVWADDEASVLEQVDAVVISQRPADQDGWIRDVVDRPDISACLLEKPLAASPEAAANILDLLEASGKRFRIGYNFRFTPWSGMIASELATIGTAGTLDIDWQFRAYHYAHDKLNWKRTVSAGGGALRFFGIHLVGLLAEWGYDDVVSSECTSSRPDECETWTATFTGPNLPTCNVRVATNINDPRFWIDCSRGNGAVERLVTLGDPFEASATDGDFDRRFGILTEVCKDLIESPVASYPWYRRSVRLWERAEQQVRANIT